MRHANRNLALGILTCVLTPRGWGVHLGKVTGFGPRREGFKRAGGDDAFALDPRRARRRSCRPSGPAWATALEQGAAHICQRPRLALPWGIDQRCKPASLSGYDLGWPSHRFDARTF